MKVALGVAGGIAAYKAAEVVRGMLAGLTPEQRENALQAVIAWGEQHLPPTERVGYIDKGPKAGDTCDDPVETPLNWLE